MTLSLPALFPAHARTASRTPAWWVAFLLAAWMLLAIAPSAQAARVPVPAQTGSVVDLTGTLDQNQTNSLRSQIAAIEQSTQAVLTVLIVPTTGEDSIEEFAIRVFDQWKPGDKDRDDGVLLLVALNDRRMRIEVGQGLEGVVPDVLAGRIIERQMKPRFRDNDYAGGLEAAITAIAAAIRGEVPEASGIADDNGDIIEDAVQSVTTSSGSGVTLFGWGFFASLVWSFAVGAVRGVRTWKWVVTAALIATGPIVVSAVLGQAGMALALLMPSALVYWLGYGVVRSRATRIVFGCFALVVGALVGLGFAVGAHRFAWGVLYVMCAMGGCLILGVIVIGMRMAYKRSLTFFCLRAMLVIGIVTFAARDNLPDETFESWIPVLATAVLSLLFIFFPSDGRSGGSSSSSSRSSSSSSSSRSSSSSSSSSRSSSSGGSSSGGGASGSW